MKHTFHKKEKQILVRTRAKCKMESAKCKFVWRTLDLPSLLSSCFFQPYSSQPSWIFFELILPQQWRLTMVKQGSQLQQFEYKRAPSWKTLQTTARAWAKIRHQSFSFTTTKWRSSEPHSLGVDLSFFFLVKQAAICGKFSVFR